MKKIGLVLSGGFGKGAYQVGALQALREVFRPEDFSAVSAASIGALNTYAYLTGILDEAADLWESVDFKGSMRSVVSVMRSTLLRDAIGRHVSDTVLPMPFYVPLVNATDRTFDYHNFSRLSKEELLKYFDAAISLPLVNSGVSIGDGVFFDGGLIDNIPVAPLVKMPLDYIICIYFDEMYTFEDARTDRNSIKITFPDDTIISTSVDIRHDSIHYMVGEGYRRTREILDFMFSEGPENIDAVLCNIARYNEQAPKPKMRITMDVVITNLNKVMRKLDRKKRTEASEAPSREGKD